MLISYAILIVIFDSFESSYFGNKNLRLFLFKSFVVMTSFYVKIAVFGREFAKCDNSDTVTAGCNLFGLNADFVLLVE